MKLPRPLFGFLAALSLVASLTACSADADPEISTDNNEGSAQEPTAPADSFWVAPIALKFAELGLQSGFEDPAESQRIADQARLETEEFIASCMQQDGFEYLPFVPPTPTSIVDRRANRDWVTQWGYGINLNPDQVAATEIVDPNAAIQARLSDSELREYNLALSGCQARALLDGTDNAEAISQAAASAIFFQGDQFFPLRQAIQQMFLDIENSPEFAEPTVDWANCMANAGWPGFTTIFDGFNFAMSERESFMDSFMWQQGMPPITELPGYTQRLPEQVEREIEIALADLDCRTSVDWSARTNAVIEDIQNQFIADHQADFEALRSAIEQGQ